MQGSSSSTPWVPTRSFLTPDRVCNGYPKLAKDEQFARAILDQWEQDEAEMIAANTRTDTPSEMREFNYQDETDGATMHGYLVRRKREDEIITTTALVPGILLFHTGAGPHDVSLFEKADLLACNKEVFPDGCVVMITDILSDESGWAWDSNRSKYNEARNKILTTRECSSHRPLLQSRIRAAIRGLATAAPEVDFNKLGAIGYCLGGQSILELGRMKVPGMKAMVTFHGVFDGTPPPIEKVVDKPGKDGSAQVLICNGDLDPFVDKETTLQYAIETLKQHGHTIRLMNLDGAKHGFSNPAQDFNPNDNFRYNEKAAKDSWRETLLLLKRAFR